MTAPLTLAEQQNLPFAEKVALARRIRRRLWGSAGMFWDEDERIDRLSSDCLRLMANDAMAADRLFQEALLP